jgi:hypothetical protein
MLNSLNVGFQAKSKINDKEWFRWCPPSTDRFNVVLDDGETSINNDDWSHISQYLQNRNRPNLIFELLANSRYLFSCGHMRSSVIEAVSALEVSLSSFGSNKNVELLSSVIQTDRIDFKSIEKQIKHMGLSGSIKYLIPLLFDKKILPSEVLDKCYKALDVRNNVVHQGQRDVTSQQVIEILDGVSTCCRVLDAYTIKQQ